MESDRLFYLFDRLEQTYIGEAMCDFSDVDEKNDGPVPRSDGPVPRMMDLFRVPSGHYNTLDSPSGRSTDITSFIEDLSLRDVPRPGPRAGGTVSTK